MKRIQHPTQEARVCVKCKNNIYNVTRLVVTLVIAFTWYFSHYKLRGCVCVCVFISLRWC